MRSVRNCPKCGANRPLYKKYFGIPWAEVNQLTPDRQFVVKAEIDICMSCNTVYATKWETIRREDYKGEKTQKKNAKTDTKLINIDHSDETDVKTELHTENNNPDSFKLKIKDKDAK